MTGWPFRLYDVHCHLQDARIGDDLAEVLARAADAGVDGVLALDVPAEESADLATALAEVGIDLIFLLSPTTTPERMALAGRRGSGSTSCRRGSSIVA